GDDRDVQRDGAGDAGADVGVGGKHLRKAGLEQHVVEGERLARAAVRWCRHGQLSSLCGRRRVKAPRSPAERPDLATQDPVAELAGVVSTRTPRCIAPHRNIWGRDAGFVSSRASRARPTGLWLAAWLLTVALWPLPGAAQQGPFVPHPAAPKAVRHPAKTASPAKRTAPAPATIGGKTIKDAAEYNDYISALNIADPAIKAASMEAFVAKYSGSVVKLDALEQAMAAYQRAGNTAKVEEIANRLLELKPDNVRALAIVTYLRRGRATQGDP